MTVDVDPRVALAAETQFRMVDCDIHPIVRSTADLRRYLAPGWHDYFEQYGNFLVSPYTEAHPYPKPTPALSRLDTWPPNGGPPGSDLAFMREQHLDPHDIEIGVLQVLWPTAARQRNLGYADALCRAINDWQAEEWLAREPRLRGSIMVSQEDPESAVAEIARCARRGGYAQLMVMPRTMEPMGRRKYWPIFAAAEAHDITLGCHVGGLNGYAVTGGAGHCSFYAEEKDANGYAMEAMLTSMVFEGVFQAFPRLRLVAIEATMAWLPPLYWRLDDLWQRFRAELPAVTRPPSEILREHLWITTQPADEPEAPRHLRDLFDWIGWDRICFASDYPHWDSDDPRHALPVRMSLPERRGIFRDNALHVYRLG
jgi:predicted TIM-barrel fold metal-dependent hydrolase